MEVNMKNVSLNKLAVEFNMSSELCIACAYANEKCETLNQLVELVHQEIGEEYGVTREKLLKESSILWKKYKDQIRELIHYEGSQDPASIAIIRGLAQYS